MQVTVPSQMRQNVHYKYYKRTKAFFLVLVSHRMPHANFPAQTGERLGLLPRAGQG